MSAPLLRYVELRRGGGGLTTDDRATILRRLGTANVRLIRNATEKDVAWVSRMGGAIPMPHRIAGGAA